MEVKYKMRVQWLHCELVDGTAVFDNDERECQQIFNVVMVHEHYTATARIHNCQMVVLTTAWIPHGQHAAAFTIRGGATRWRASALMKTS